LWVLIPLENINMANGRTDIYFSFLKTHFQYS
jgi:hypothetical protein